MNEPPRLTESDELPSMLRDGFRLLEREAPPPDAVARVQQALQALPPAAPALVAVGGVGLGKLIVLATLVAGAVTSLVLVRSAPPVARDADRVASHAQPDAQPGAYAAVGDGREHTPASFTRPAPAGISPPPDAREAQATRTAARSASSRSDPRGKRLSTDSPNPARAQAGRARETSTAAPRPAQPPVAAAGAPASPAASDTLAPPTSAADRQATEAALLARAKRLATSDAQAALRQLETLEIQYPNGTFAPERELLAIQLHERLGHVATAQRLARRFRERYPSSVYRRALPP